MTYRTFKFYLVPHPLKAVLLLPVVALLAFLTFMILHAEPASAASCYASSCEGLDPAEAGCYANEDLDEIPYVHSRMIVKSSETCKTLWLELRIAPEPAIDCSDECEQGDGYQTANLWTSNQKECLDTDRMSKCIEFGKILPLSISARSEAGRAVVATSGMTNGLKYVRICPHNSAAYLLPPSNPSECRSLGSLPINPNYEGRKVSNIHSGKCMDVAGGAMQQGNKLQLYTCNSTVAQSFTFREDGTIRVGNKCLRVKDDKKGNGVSVVLHTCKQGWPSMQWKVTDSGQIVNHSQETRCLDVRNNQRINGTALQVWSCKIYVPSNRPIQAQAWSIQYY